MQFKLIPKNESLSDLVLPLGIWNPLCVETPVRTVTGCSYMTTGAIRYKHQGFTGAAWFSSAEVAIMREELEDFVLSDTCATHHFFADKDNLDNLNLVIDFLKECSGFLMEIEFPLRHP